MNDRDDDEWDDEDWDDIDEPEETGTITCPACGAEVYEESPACPVCGEYIVASQRSSPPWEGKPIWYVLLGVIGIFSVIAALLFVWL